MYEFYYRNPEVTAPPRTPPAPASQRTCRPEVLTPPQTPPQACVTPTTTRAKRPFSELKSAR